MFLLDRSRDYWELIAAGFSLDRDWCSWSKHEARPDSRVSLFAANIPVAGDWSIDIGFLLNHGFYRFSWSPANDSSALVDLRRNDPSRGGPSSILGIRVIAIVSDLMALIARELEPGCKQ